MFTSPLTLDIAGIKSFLLQLFQCLQVFFSLHFFKPSTFYVMYLRYNIIYTDFWCFILGSSYMNFPWNSIIKWYTLAICQLFLHYCTFNQKRLERFVCCGFNLSIFLIKCCDSVNAASSFWIVFGKEIDWALLFLLVIYLL